MSLTRWVDQLSLHGGANEQAGCVQDAGMFAMLFLNLDESQGDAGWLDEDDKAFLADHPHCILTEDSQGFIDTDWFSTKEEALAAWAQLAEALDSYLIDTSIDE